MPDPKKPLTPKQLKTAPVVTSPRQQVLDASARETGSDLAGFRDGESYELLKDAKAAVGHVESKPLSKMHEGLYPWIGKQATGEEVPRYQTTMEGQYDKKKDEERQYKGKPTGYDAAMRGAPTSPVPTADAMKADAARKPLSPKQLKTAPMFEKRTK